MSTLRDLEKQLSRLQDEVKELREQFEASSPTQLWWEKLAGSAEGRPLFGAVDRAGREIRQVGRKPIRSQSKSS
jgi:hypothetical protein